MLSSHYHTEEYEEITVLGSDIVSRVSNHNVILSDGWITSLISNHSSKTNSYIYSPSNLEKIVGNIVRQDIEQFRGIVSAIEIVKTHTSEVFEIYKECPEILNAQVDHEKYKVVISLIDSYMVNKSDIAGYDVFSKSYQYIPMTESNLKYRDLFHTIINIATLKLKDHVVRMTGGNYCNYSGSTCVELDSGMEIPVLRSKKSSHIIFNGDFSGERLSMNEFLTLAEEDKSKYVIMDDSIPISLMNEAFKAKAIIIRKGSPHSHICMSAKESRKALKIE